MAYLKQEKCSKCGKIFEATSSAGMPTPDWCYECTAKEKDRKRRQYFSGLDGLTIEERLRKVEEWIYNYKPYKEPKC